VTEKGIGPERGQTGGASPSLEVRTWGDIDLPRFESGTEPIGEILHQLRFVL
jgi:hypothetical protein